VIRFSSIALLALSLCAPALAQEAKDSPLQTVAPAGSIAPVPVPEKFFTGHATVQILASPIAPGRASFGEVTFQPGARSHWHTHPAGQILYVLKGCGLTQQDGGPVTRICEGDTVYTPAGVRHWHGATPTTAMTQLTITETVDGRNVDWMEPVTDAAYQAPEAKRK